MWKNFFNSKMRIFKSHPLLKILNSYLIDVRPVGSAILGTKRLYHRETKVMAAGLSTRENRLPNTACRLKRGRKCKATSTVKISAISPMLRATLPKLKWLWTSKIGLHPSRNRMSYANLPGWIYTGLSFAARTNFAKRISKVMSPEAKGERPTVPRRSGKDTVPTRGLPKGGNPQGSRAYHNTCNAASQGRVAGSTIRHKGSCTGLTRDKAMTKLSGLFKKAEKFQDKIIVDDIYKRFILDKNLHLVAYDKLKSKPGNMTPAISPETLDGISDEELNKIIKLLKTEKFRFSTSRRVHIPKKDGSLRPLTVGNPRDKIVQEVMRMVLEAIFEPRFKDSSHGFRPNRGCHTALRAIFSQFHGVWVIEGDFSKCFDTIDHHKLMELLSKNIKDSRFVSLLWKALRAGYYNFKRITTNIIGTPQGSVISPILANIFLHQLDIFVATIKTEFEKGKQQKVRKEWLALNYQLTKAKKKGDVKAIRDLLKKRRSTPSIVYDDPNYKRLYYVRYADDWLLGVTGSRHDAENILSRIISFCESIGLKVNLAKTKITNLHTDQALFLGTNVKFTRHIGYSRTKSNSLSKRKIGPRIMLTAPIQRIRQKLSAAGFIKRNRAIPKWLWLPFNPAQIIDKYNSIYNGYMNYYSFVQNKGKLAGFLYFHLKSSCLKLLAAKLKLKTQAQVYKRFGKNIKIFIKHKDKDGRVTTKVKQFVTPKYSNRVWDFKTNPSPIIEALYANPKSLATLMGLECAICGSTTKVEMHHIRKMSELKARESEIDRLMIKANRKQIALCRKCHMDKHTATSQQRRRRVEL